jgi:hypothetical protein
MMQSDIEKAGKLAEQLSLKIRNSNGNLSVVYYKIEEILINYQKTGGELELVMPGIYDVDIQYNHTSPDGRSIWIAYADVLHEDLCNPDGVIHKKIKMDINTTGTSIVLLIMNQLRLPPSSAMLVAPIAASILGLGIKAFCRHSDDGECKDSL